MSSTLDIGRVLDDGPFTGLQKMVIFMAAMAIVLDGFDGQMIGFAIPLIIKEWGITKAAFAPAVASGLVGMAVGMAVAGIAADRIGRRLVLAASVLLFGAATVAIGFSPDVMTIIALRFVAGLGIGGALPSASTMTAEFAPARIRTMAVTITIVCFPLGGMLAGLFAGLVLPMYGWRGLFWIGGAIPVLFSLAMFARLPESPRFLAHHRARWAELVALLARMGRATPPGTVFSDAAEQAAGDKARVAANKAANKAGFGALFQGGLARDTLALCTAFFMVVLALYTAFSWLPSMLAAEGVPVALASQGLTAYNLGGVIGSLLCAVFIARFGSRWPITLACLAAALSAFAMSNMQVADNVAWLIFGFGVHGMFVNAAQVSLYALCAYVYQTNVRATGTATALAVGRGGGILSAFIGAAVITSGGASGFLGLLAATMLLAAVAVFAVRRHIPGLARRGVAATSVMTSH